MAIFPPHSPPFPLEKVFAPASDGGEAGTRDPTSPEGALEPDLWLPLKAPLSAPPSPLPHRALRIPRPGLCSFCLAASGFSEPGRRVHGAGRVPRERWPWWTQAFGVETRDAHPPGRIPAFPVPPPSAEAENRGCKGRSPVPPYLSSGAAAPRARARAPGSGPAAAGPACPGRRRSPRALPQTALPGGVPFNFGICSIPNVKDPKISVPRGVPRRGGGGEAHGGAGDSHSGAGRGGAWGGRVPAGVGGRRGHRLQGRGLPSSPALGRRPAGPPRRGRFPRPGREEAALRPRAAFVRAPRRGLAGGCVPECPG